MRTFTAIPLVKYSSLNHTAILGLLSIKVVFNFNVQTSAPQNAQAQLTFNLRDASIMATPESSDFSITNLTRWQRKVANYLSFADFFKALSRSQQKKYQQTKDAFSQYGASISIIEDDWSPYANEAYQLYLNVAKRYGSQLYDLNFFQTIAKLKEYKLMCVWYQKTLIGILVIMDEEPIVHSMVVGMDYDHSKKSYVYSQMHYELVRFAIEAKKYTLVDIGLTANKAKEMMGFKPTSYCMDIYAKNYLVKGMLHILSRFMTATINSNSKLELKFHVFK